VLQRLRPRRVTWLWPVLLAVLPWTWFLWRDHTGPVGDVVAIVLPVLVVLVALAELAVAAARRRWALVPAVVSVLALGAVAVLTPWSAQDAGAVDPAGAVRIASANITGAAGDPSALLADPADVTVISENAPAIDARLTAAYPYRAYGGPQVTDGVGVYSRYPLQLVRGAGPDLPGLEVRVAAPVPFTLFALHVPRPWFADRGYEVSPSEHHRIVVALAAAAAVPGPVVLTGDLNTSDRGRDYRVLAAGLTDAMRAAPTRPTSVTTWRLLLLKIDHLFVGPGWCGDDPGYPPLPGSDHDAITAAVGPCR
jgi:endonuclease/exonuclease/phosphatase (EEP) superfamily protein YafD